MIPEINLLPKMERKSNRLKWVLATFVLIVISTLVFFTFQLNYLTKDLKTLRVEEKLYEQLQIKLHEKLTTVENPEEPSIEESIQYLESITYPVSPVLTEINSFLSKKLLLEQYEMNGNHVSITISSTSIPDVANLVEQLTNSPYFKDVQVKTVIDYGNKNDYQNIITLTIQKGYLQTGGDGQ